MSWGRERPGNPGSPASFDYNKLSRGAWQRLLIKRAVRCKHILKISLEILSQKEKCGRF